MTQQDDVAEAPGQEANLRRWEVWEFRQLFKLPLFPKFPFIFLLSLRFGDFVLSPTHLSYGSLSADARPFA